MTTIDEAVRLPRYVQAYTALKGWILQGAYAPGARLPSETELCSLFGVSRITVRAAVEMLEKQGLVQREQGRGTFVADSIDDTPAQGDFSELVRRVRRLDKSSTLANITIAQRPADEAVARDLEIAVGQELLQISYTRMRDDLPIGLTDLSIPARLGVTVSEDDLRRAPAPTLLADRGFEISGAHQLIGATLADGRIASGLKTTVGAPIVQVRLLVLDCESRPIELLSAYYLADYYVHHVFLAAEPAHS